MPLFKSGGQKTRFEPSRLNTIWHTVIGHLTPPSHPSTTSESAVGTSAYDPSGEYYSESVTPPAHLALELLNPKSGVSGKHKIRRSVGERSGGRKKKSSVGHSTSRFGDDDDTTNHDAVIHVVVENDFDHFQPHLDKSDSGSTKTPGGTSEGGMGGTGNDEDVVYDKTESGSIRRDRRSSWIKRTSAWELVFDRIWPNVKHFMDSSFPEDSKERSFQKEAWFTQKQGAIASACFYLIAWILTVALTPTPFSAYNYYAYLGIAGVFTIPLLLFVVIDYPRRYPRIWQPILFGATWSFPYIIVGEMFSCGFFADDNQCGSRNFLNLLGWAFGQPVLALLALRQGRDWAIFGAITWLCLVGGMLMTAENAPVLFARNMVTFALFHAFLIATSFLKERSDRQMFALRQQLKIQYRATQSAQVQERRAADSKKRFVSYIFHEVRVPLNTALLAVQNLDGEEVFQGLHEDQAEMVHGLMGSLSMMEKVLNDVLSFNRMESGKFAQARKPFEFHKSIQLVALSHRMQAQMAGIDLIVDLDKNIDKIGGMFVGDEMRLRQVASNLVSNSIKFTPTGSVRIVTKLLFPRLDETPSTELDDPLNEAAVNAMLASPSITDPSMVFKSEGDVEKGSIQVENKRQSSESKRPDPKKYRAVVRVEIHDTGVGLRKQDIIDNRLFSPYVQTEIGRRQGGKGSGLGLALVRQIVKLSNGRLGVESQYGKGSMFWFELPYALPMPKQRSKDIPRPDMARRHTSQLPSVTIIDTAYPDPPGQPISEKAEFHRPEMVNTESTVPLLGRPPQDSPSENQIGTNSTGSSEETPADIGYIDPFSFAARERDRRSSDWSSTATKTDIPTPLNQTRSPPASNGEAPLRTLVVDDDKLTRMLMSRMLSRLGHTVTTAENGKIALDMIKETFENDTHIYDVIFLDNQMPLMSGVEVAREVREMGCPVYIVGCTGNALREDQEEYIAAGADGIIPKPIHQKLVLDMIKEARKRIAGETTPKNSPSDHRPRSIRPSQNLQSDTE